MRHCLSKAKKRHPTAKSETRGHGREETRVGIVVKARGIAEHHDFPGLKAFGRIEATRAVIGKVETDVLARERKDARGWGAYQVRPSWRAQSGSCITLPKLVWDHPTPSPSSWRNQASLGGQGEGDLSAPVAR